MTQVDDNRLVGGPRPVTSYSLPASSDQGKGHPLPRTAGRGRGWRFRLVPRSTVLTPQSSAAREGFSTRTLLALILIPTCALSIVSAGPNTLPGDVAVGQAVQELDSWFFDLIAFAGNFIGEGRTVFTAAVALLVGALSLRRWSEVVFLSLLVVLRLATVTLKAIVESPRPTEDHLRLHSAYDDFGFPSGHATSATVLTGVLIVLVLHRIHHPVGRCIGILAGLLIALITGFARVYVGAHWPSDVLGGYLWGTVIVLVAVGICRHTPLPTRRRSRPATG